MFFPLFNKVMCEVRQLGRESDQFGHNRASNAYI
jgi:hypothetical protein